MFDRFYVTLPTFGSLLALGGVFFILLYFYAVSRAGDAVKTFSESVGADRAVSDRLLLLGITNWGTLRQKAGLTHRQLLQVRSGDITQLKLNQLIQLASALNWKLDELLHHFGVSKAYREIEALRREGLRLHEELQQQSVELKIEFQYSTFQQLQTLLTNYPSVRQMAQAKPDLPAKNLISLFTPLENLLQSWKYEPIGSAWEQVAYNPQLHQPDASDMQEGELVYIRFVGYRGGDRILCPAKVSRTLPIKN